MKVLVVGRNGIGLMPTTPRKARLLLKAGKAEVTQRIPFTIRLTYQTGSAVQDIRLGIDTGECHIGIAVTSNSQVLTAAEVKLRSSMEKRTLMETSVVKNPFAFQLAGVVVNTEHTREAITKEQMRKFLKFVHDDNVYCKYYEVFYILFHTGLRISEFCGLTIKDLDMKNRIINIDHQLQRLNNMEYHIESTKTNAGTRKIPMTEDVYRMFQAILEDRPTDLPEVMLNGYVGFLFRRVCSALRPVSACGRSIKPDFLILRSLAREIPALRSNSARLTLSGLNFSPISLFISLRHVLLFQLSHCVFLPL